MKHPIPDYLNSLIDGLKDNREGEVAQYIPTLAAADPDRFGVALATVTGRLHSAGDDETEFTIQSISKPFTYAAALKDRGRETVDEFVGLNPSGEAFNELSLEEDSNRPDNAMINAGALAVHQLLVGPFAGRQERIDRAVAMLSELAGRPLSIDRDSYEAEMGTADRNLALGHMLRSHGIIHDRVEDVVAGYIALCSVNVTVRDIAVMGACLASGGVHPMTGQRVLPSLVTRQVLSVMSSSGMYDAAGQWLADIGIPAKSGVAGGVLGALPGQGGIGVFSPRLDSVGNSVRGVQVCRSMSEDLNLHIMEADALGGTVVRFVRRQDDCVYMHLQGVVRFGGSEAVLAAMTELCTGSEERPGWETKDYPDQEGGTAWRPEDPQAAAERAANLGDGAVYQATECAAGVDSGIARVVLNLDRVDRVTSVGRRFIAEGIRRLEADGVRVEVQDPDGLLAR
ncbi:MAG: glutaminase A [Micrococcus sp.]|nr:glutaminase A [Micrococcus sp.]